MQLNAADLMATLWERYPETVLAFMEEHADLVPREWYDIALDEARESEERVEAIEETTRDVVWDEVNEMLERTMKAGESDADVWYAHCVEGHSEPSGFCREGACAANPHDIVYTALRTGGFDL